MRGRTIGVGGVCNIGRAWCACQHVRSKVAAQREHAGQVDLEHLVPIRLGKLVRWVPALDARARHEDRHVVAVGEDFRRHAGDFGLAGEVGRVDCRLAPERFDGEFG